MEYLAAVGAPGVMLVLDIKQAYDRVNRGWLLACAHRLGLGDGCMRWLRLFMANTRSRVVLNGHVSPDFAVLNGLPQGGPLAPLLWVLQLQPFTAALERAQASGLLRSPLLPSGAQVPPVSHHADDTKLYLRDLGMDGAGALACVSEFTLASGAIMHPDKNTGVLMGSHAPVVGTCPVTQAVFGAPGSPPVVSLGVPCTVDMQVAAAVVYPKRLRAVQALRAIWRVFPLSMVGRTLNSKQLMANTLCYHAMFVPPPAADLSAIADVIMAYVTTSDLSEDRTISSWGRLQLLPKRGIACLPYGMGGLAVPDLPSQVASLQAKVLAGAFSPGPHPWKALMLHALASAAPAPALGPAWVLLPSVPVPAGLHPRLLAYVLALRSCTPSLLQNNFDRLPDRALLLLPLSGIHARMPALPALPLQPPAGWPYLLGQLATCPVDVRASPALAALEAALPSRLAAVLALAARGEAGLREQDTCWVSSDHAVVAMSGAPGGPRRIFRVAASGALSDLAPTPAFDEASAVPACVLEVPKPKYQWTAEECAAYAAAPPRERPSLRPTHRCLLGPWDEVRVYPGSWSVAGVPLHQYSASAARSHLTGLAAAAAVTDRAPAYVPGQPLRPRLWPQPGAPLASGLHAVEAGWARYHAATGARLLASAAPVVYLRNWQQPRPPDSPFRRPASERRAALAAAVAAAAAGAAAGPSAPAAAPLPASPRSPRSPSSSAASSRASSRSPSPPPSPPPRPPSPPRAPPAPAARPPPHPWLALWHLPASNRVKVFGNRLLHGALPCRAMVAGMRARPSSYLRCPACARAAAPGASVPSETYSHLFLDCPIYRPILQWLVSLWAALPGSTPPPLEASVIITAEPGAPWQPAQARARVWHCLRLITLHAIWDARVSDDPARQTAAAVVASVIASVSEEIKLQHARCCHRELHARRLPAAVLAMRRLQAAVDDYSAWAAAGLCQVLDAGSPGGGHLVVLLSASWPVQAPV